MGFSSGSDMMYLTNYLKEREKKEFEEENVSTYFERIKVDI